jgi:multidrug efflux pump subunit AcrA (membrane-fusion protein)
LAQRDFDRVGTLVKSGGAECEARLDQVSATVTQRKDQVVSLERALALYPTRRGMLEARLKSARARVDLAAANIERTTVRAPYDARIVTKSIELQQRVAPGMEALLLADDSVLEIPVSLDGFEVSRWLDVERDPADPHWVGKFANHPVRVEWSEDKSEHPYEGRLDRIESYNSDTRTFHVVVAIDATHFDPNASAPFPLTDGMFCEVAIPGRLAENVIPVPRDAVDSSSTVLVSEDGKLRTRPVEIVRYQQDVALIALGIEDKAIVLTSRPPRVIDGMNLEVSLLDATAVIQESGRPVRSGDEPAAAVAATSGSNSTARPGLENL